MSNFDKKNYISSIPDNTQNYSSWTWIRLFLTIVLVSVKFIWYCNFNLWFEILVLLPNRKYIILRFKRRFVYHVYFYILRFIWTFHSLQETMSECLNLNFQIGVWNFSFSLNNVIVYHPMVSFLEYICIAFICPLFVCRVFFRKHHQFPHRTCLLMLRHLFS